MIGCRIGKKTKRTARRRRSIQQVSAASGRLHFLGRFGDSDGGAQFAGHADEKAFRELVATLHVVHPVGMSGIADNNAFLARRDDSGGSLLTLHFSQQERIEILRLAAAHKTTPEELIRGIIRRHLPHDVAWNRRN